MCLNTNFLRVKAANKLILLFTVYLNIYGNKLENHNPATTNKQRHFYFVRICRLWNALPLIDLNLSVDIIRNRIKSFFWDHFTNHFDPLDSHTLHYLCPCSRCVTDHFSINYSTL